MKEVVFPMEDLYDVYKDLYDLGVCSFLNKSNQVSTTPNSFLVLKKSFVGSK